MKKLLSALVILIIIGLLGAPFVLGLNAEKKAKALAANLNSYPGYSVSWHNYQRHWFSSQARLQVTFDIKTANNPLADGNNIPKISFPLVINIDQGPLLFGEHFGFGWYRWQVKLSPQQTKNLQKSLTINASGPLYQFTGYTHLSGETSLNDRILPFNWRSKDKTKDTVAFSGYQGSGTVSANGLLDYTGKLDSIHLKTTKATGQLNGLTTTMNGDLSQFNWDNSLYPNKMNISITSANLKTNNKTNMALQQLSITSAVTMPENDRWFNINSHIQLKKAVLNGRPLTDTHINIGLDNIDVKAYQAYINAIKDTHKNAQGKTVPSFTKYFTHDVMQAFVARGPALQLKQLRFTLPEGKADLSASVNVKADTQAPEKTTNPLWLIGALQAQAQTTIDRTLAQYFSVNAIKARAQQTGTTADDIDEKAKQQASATLNMLTQQGLLVAQGKTLTSQITFNKGQLNVNGKPIPLGALLGANAGH